MRSGTLSVLTLALLLLTPGCLKVKSSATLKKDGSGTYVQTSVLDMTNALAYQDSLIAHGAGLGLDVGEGGEDPFEALDPKKRAADLKDREGVRVSGSASEDKEKKTRTYELRASFDSLRAFYEAGVVDDVSVELKLDDDGKTWELTVRNVFDGNDREPLEGPAAEKRRQMRAAMLAVYREWWGNMEIVSTLKLPTKILKTNGKKSEDGLSVTWRVGFKDLADPRALRQSVTFENAKDLKLKAFSLSAEDIANAREEAEIAREEREAAEAEERKREKKGK